MELRVSFRGDQLPEEATDLWVYHGDVSLEIEPDNIFERGDPLTLSAPSVDLIVVMLLQRVPEESQKGHSVNPLHFMRALISESREESISARDDLAQWLSAAQLVEARRLVAEWSPQRANN